MADVDITSLSVEISAESQGAELSIDKLTTAISKLRTKGSIGKVCSSLDTLTKSISALKSASSGMDGLSRINDFMDRISNVNLSESAKGIRSVASALTRISSVDLKGIDLSGLKGKMNSLQNGLSPLSKVDASGLRSVSSALNSIAKIPDFSSKLNSKTLDDFATSCKKITDALDPLASKIETVGNSFAKLPTNIQKVIAATDGATKSSSKSAKSYLSLSNQLNGFIRSAAKLVSLKAIATYLGNAAKKFNSYYEAANLFGVSMKGLTGEANTFINKMETLLGIDPTEAMNNMATIQSLTTSFGLASDKAYVLSKNLTQLGYDLASLKNIPVAESFTKIQAAISGELEPIRRLGVDISNARLQQELLNLGYSQSVSTLSQADKAVLRYIAIMKQTTDAQGDFARTLSSPANMIRILQAQLNSLARAVGSLLYPALKSILPPLIAAVELIKELVTGIASLMGVKVEFPDFSSASDAVGGVTDAMDNTTKATGKAAKAFKNYIMGFDELNVIQKDNGSSGGSGSGAGAAGNILGDVDLSGYDMFKNYVGTSIDEMKQKIKSMLPLIESIAAAFALWELGKFIKQIGEVIKGMNGIQKAAAMIAILVVEWTLVQKFSDSFLKTGDVKAFFAEWLTTAAAAIGGYALFGAEGASLALIVSAVAQLESIKTNLSQGTAKATDASVWIQGISAAVTTGIAGAVFTKTATGFSLGLSVGAVLALSAITYGGTKGGSIKPGDSIDMLLTALTAAAGGLAGVTLALAAGASAPIAGAALILGVGVGVVLEQLGITFGKKDRIKDVEDYIKRYEDAGYTTLAIHYRLKNLGFSDNEINMAEQGIDSTFEIFRYTFNEKLEALNEWWSQKWEGFKENIGKSWDSLKNFAANYWENNSLIHGLIEQTKQNIADLKETLGTIRKAFDQKVKDIEESAANAGRAAAEWVNGVLDKFRKKRDEFFNAGKNLIQGFIDGIKNLKEQAISSVTSIATSAVDKFKSLLGIHSPSTVFAEIGGYIDQGLANGIASAIPYVTTAMQGVVDAVQEKGNELIAAGSTQATNYVTGFLSGLDTQWQQIDSSLQNDFLGSMKTLGTAIEKGDLQSLGKWAASYFYHAMDDEQRKQIKSIANNSLQWLTQGLSSVWNNIAGMASSFIGQLVPSTVAATTAQTGLNIAMDANPILFVVSLIAMLAGALLNLAGTNSDVAGGISSVWGGLKDFMSYIFEGIVRLLGTFVQGFINGVNIMIGAYNLVAQLWGGQIDYIKNPLFEYADKIAAARENSSSVDSLASGNVDYSNVPGTSQYSEATSSGSYTSSYSRSAELTPSELRDSVKEGFIAAMRESGFGDTDNGNFTVRVYLDGKEITSAVEKRQSDRGMSLMGTEAYSY